MKDNKNTNLGTDRIPLTMIELFSGIGAQKEGIDLTELFDCKVVATSDIEKDTIVSYAAIHNGFTNQIVDDYNKYPTEEQMKRELLDKNIGFDFKKNSNPISRIKGSKLKKYWLAMKMSNNLGDISKIKTLPLADFWTYSFPCQDISLAGKQAGIVKCETRSGLLYEVERLLETAKNDNTLPKYLLLENVKNLVGKKFIDQFNEWVKRLDELGFNTYWEVVNAKNCGIAQNRERVFALSIRKDVDTRQFEFMKPFDCGLRLKDFLENVVDEKYYLSEKRMEIIKDNLGNVFEDNFIIGSSQKNTYVGDESISPSLTSAMGNGGGQTPMIKDCVNDSDTPIRIGNVYGKQFGTGYAGNVWDKDGVSPTLMTMQGGGRQPHIITGLVSAQATNFDKETDCANTLLARDYKGFGNQSMNAVIEVTEKEPKVKETVKIPQATKQGYIECEVGGVADLSYPNSKTRRGRVQDRGNICPTITSEQNGLCRIEPKERFFKQALDTFKDNDCSYGDTIDAFNERVNKSGYCPTLTTRPEGFKTAILPVTKEFRIRKLTPKECWRLMGFSDSDFNKASEIGISDSALYKQAGNSIVTNCIALIMEHLYKAQYNNTYVCTDENFIKPQAE